MRHMACLVAKVTSADCSCHLVISSVCGTVMSLWLLPVAATRTWSCSNRLGFVVLVATLSGESVPKKKRTRILWVRVASASVCVIK